MNWVSSKEEQFSWQRHCREELKVPNICLFLSLPFLSVHHPIPTSPVPSSPPSLPSPFHICPSVFSPALLLPPAPPHSFPRCCLAPASAAKFPEAVLAAGLTPETPAEILALELKETRCTPMRKGDDWTLMLRDTIESLGWQQRGHFLNAPK